MINAEWAHSRSDGELIIDGIHDKSVDEAHDLGTFTSMSSISQFTESTSLCSFEDCVYFVIPRKPFTYVKDEIIHCEIIFKGKQNMIRSLNVNEIARGNSDSDCEKDVRKFLKDPKGQLEFENIDFANIHQGGKFEDSHRAMCNYAVNYTNEHFPEFYNGVMNSKHKIWDAEPFTIASTAFGKSGIEEKASEQITRVQGCNLVGIGLPVECKNWKEFSQHLQRATKKEGFFAKNDYKEPMRVYVLQQNNEKWFKINLEL